MNRPRQFRHALVSLLGLSAAASTALAHPGHDGDHGGGLTWDFLGELLHRLSSPYHLAPAVIVALLAFGAWRVIRGKRTGDQIAKK